MGSGGKTAKSYRNSSIIFFLIAIFSLNFCLPNYRCVLQNQSAKIIRAHHVLKEIILLIIKNNYLPFLPNQIYMIKSYSADNYYYVHCFKKIIIICGGLDPKSIEVNATLSLDFSGLGIISYIDQTILIGHQH